MLKPLSLLFLCTACSALWPIADEKPDWARQQVVVRSLSERDVKELPTTSADLSGVLEATLESDISQIVPLSGGFSAVVGLHNGKILLVDYTPGGTLFSEVLIEAGDSLSAFRVSPDERFIALAVFSKLLVVNIEEARITSSTSEVRGRVTSLSWSSEGDVVVGGLADGRLFSWDVKDQNDVSWYVGATSSILDVLVHPAGRFFFASEQDGSVWLWRLTDTEIELGLRDPNAKIDIDREGYFRKELVSASSSVRQLFFDDDASYLYGLSGSGELFTWKVRGLIFQPERSKGLEQVALLAALGDRAVGLTKSQKFISLELGGAEIKASYSARTGLRLTNFGISKQDLTLWASDSRNTLLVGRNFLKLIE